MKNIVILLKHFGGLIAKNPVNTVFAVLFLFFAARTYLGDGHATDRICMVAALVFWAIWFLMTHMLFLFLVSVIIGGVVYIGYEHNQRLKAECEQSGGYWNAKTRQCEEKKTLGKQIKAIWNEVVGKLSDETKNAVSKDESNKKSTSESQK